MAIAAGRLRHRVRIEQRTLSQNELGEVLEDWQEVATVWAAIEPLSGRELIAAQQVNSKVTARLVIRYRSDLLPEMRLVHHKQGQDVIYNPAAFLEDKDSGLEYLTIPCSRDIASRGVGV